MTTINGRNHRVKTCKPSFHSKPYSFMLDDHRTGATYYFSDVTVHYNSFVYGGAVHLEDRNGDVIVDLDLDDVDECVADALSYLQEHGELPGPEELPDVVDDVVERPVYEFE